MFRAFGAHTITWVVGSPAFSEFVRAKDARGFPADQVGPCGKEAWPGDTVNSARFPAARVSRNPEAEVRVSQQLKENEYHENSHK